jgi:energy-coupling factor transport system permease protein
MVSAGVVVEMRKPVAPWARSFNFFVKLAILVVTIRVLAQVLIGAPGGTTTVVPMPGATLPDWLAGVRLGGDVMLEPLLGAFYDGLRLAAILVVVGAASSLASPARLLKSVPAAIYEIGVSVVVAATFLPQLVNDLARIRANRRLRGRSDTGLRGYGAAAMPVLHGAMDRSITLAAAMDSRGYGRAGYRSTTERHISAAILLAGLLLATIGTYGLLGTGAATWWGPTFIAFGACFIILNMILAGRRSTRTRYRPNVWHPSDVSTALVGAIVAGLFVAASNVSPSVMTPAVSPPTWPSLSLLSVVGLLIATIPAFITPTPPKGAS